MYSFDNKLTFRNIIQFEKMIGKILGIFYTLAQDEPK